MYSVGLCMAQDLDGSWITIRRYSLSGREENGLNMAVPAQRHCCPVAYSCMRGTPICPREADQAWPRWLQSVPSLTPPSSSPASHLSLLTPHSSPGATMISCFCVRMRRKVSSLLGSRSLTVVLVLPASWCSRAAYCTVVALSMVVLMGIPGGWTS